MSKSSWPVDEKKKKNPSQTNTTSSFKKNWQTVNKHLEGFVYVRLIKNTKQKSKQKTKKQKEKRKKKKEKAGQ